MRHALLGAALQAASSEGTPASNLPQGPYRLSSVLGSSPCLDIKWAQTANATPVQAFTCNGTQAQSWSLIPVSGSRGSGYQVVSSVSGSCLDVAGVSVLDGGNVFEWNCLGAEQANQIWQVYPFGNYVELVSLNSGKCLDLPGGNTVNGTPLQQWRCGGGNNPNQLWKLSSLTSLQAAAQPQLAANASALNFGSVTVGNVKTLTLTLTSSGSSAVTVNSLSISGSGYSLGTSAATPLTLNPGGTVGLTIRYQPTGTGPASGSLSIRSNSTAGNTIGVSLSGAGTGANTGTGTGSGIQHSVEVTWDAPPSSPDAVAGYRIYRSTSGGNFNLQNSTLTTAQSYLDSTVASGIRYEYIVKSVDGSGVESVASNNFVVTVP